MPSVEKSIIIEAPVDFTIDVSNELERWPEMMSDYTAIEILRREGWKVWFRLFHTNGTSWTSWRVVDREGRFALAERHEPRAPFVFMQHVWLYQELGDGRTQMRWVMNFELPEETRPREAEMCAYLASHSAANQARMKAHIERRYGDGSPVMREPAVKGAA